jgi:hypothetical protein
MKEQLISSKPEEDPPPTMYEITARTLTVLTVLSFVVVWSSSFVVEGYSLNLYFQGMGGIEVMSPLKRKELELACWVLDHSIRFMCICAVYPLYYFRQDFFHRDTLPTIFMACSFHLLLLVLMLAQAYSNITGPIFLILLGCVGIVIGCGILFLAVACLFFICKHLNKEVVMGIVAVVSIISVAILITIL